MQGFWATIARLKHTARWARMAGKKRKTAAAGTLLLQKVTPAIPTDPEEFRVLESYLELMGCNGLLGVPWAFQSEGMVTELVGKPPNQHDGRLRAHPEEWKVALWRSTYGFREGDVKVAERNDDFLKEEFVRDANPKDGYVLGDLRDPDARLVMAFLNPIFHPEKPKRVVAKLASLFLGAMRGKHTVDWAVLMQDQVLKMVKNLPKVRKTPSALSTYIGHLYAKTEMLSPEEQNEYDELLSIQSYGGMETDSEKESDTAESPPSSPVTLQRTRKRSRSVQKDPEPDQAGPSQPPQETPAQMPEGSTPGQPGTEEGGADVPLQPELTGDPALDIKEMCYHILMKARILDEAVKDRTGLIMEVMKDVGVNDLADLFPRIKELKQKEIRLQLQEEQQANFAKSNTHLRKQLEKAEAELGAAQTARTEAEAKADASARLLVEVRAALSFPVDTVNRSLLYTESLEKQEKLTRGQIIRFLLDHSRKMETTWKKMQELVQHLIPEAPRACGTQVPEEPLLTPEKASTPSGTPKATPGDFIDLAGTPELISPFSWSKTPHPSTGTIKMWQSMMPEGLSQGTPPVFRIPSESPSPDPAGKRASPLSPQATDMEISPSVSFRSLLHSRIQGTEAVSPPKGPAPESSAGKTGKELESSQEHPDTDRSADEGRTRRRSSRNKSQVTP